MYSINKRVNNRKKTLVHKKLYVLVSVALLVGAGAVWYIAGRGPAEAASFSSVELQDGAIFSLDAKAVTMPVNGKVQPMLAYNGSIPGPTLKVKQGSNATVRFTNRLDTDTAVHFHGIRADNAFDGVVGVTQKAVKPGETFDYKLTFPDPGIYWYHPHLREDATQPLGLYGSVIVQPADKNYWPPVNKELPLMVGDLLMDKDNIVPFDKQRANYTLMGRFGNTMLVNGSPDYRVEAVAGEVDRLYLTNVANARPFKLVIPGAKLKLVGADSGAYERETFVDSVILAPSERIVVDVLFSRPGTFKLQNMTPAKISTLATFTVAAGKPAVSYASRFATLASNAEVAGSINPFRADFGKPADKALTLSLTLNQPNDSRTGSDSMADMPGMENMEGMDMPADTIEWEDAMPDMNKASTTKSLTWKLIDQQTKAENDKIDWQFQRGQRVKIRLFNDPNSAHAMQHPIHIHGQRFLVTSVNGKPVDNQVWKDTVLVPKGDTVEVLVDMSNPGTWLIHCHIPEHMESGMSMRYTVQ